MSGADAKLACFRAGAAARRGLVAPLASGAAAPGFYVEVLLGGLMSGVMYSLVALGFVLIFKASGVFNFAQGAMVLFAALSVARIGEVMPLPVAFVLDRRHHGRARLVDRAAGAAPPRQPGGGCTADGDARRLLFPGRLRPDDLGQRHLPHRHGIAEDAADGSGKIFEGGILINSEDLSPRRSPPCWCGALALFFQKTPTGRALRAVADDHQAAQSIGIPLNRIWVIVWTVAGVVALVAGMIWGSKLGVQFSLSLIALKALPVVILGGFTSVPGAILGGLIIGVGEKMAEVFLGPPLVKAFDLAGGGIENWFAYVLALLFLLVRPEGLFGEKHIDRV